MIQNGRLSQGLFSLACWPLAECFFLNFNTKQKFSFHDYLCGCSLWLAFPLTTLMFSLVPTFYLSSPLSFPYLVFKGNYHFTSEMSESYTSLVSWGALLGWMEFFTDKDEWLSPTNPEPSDIASLWNKRRISLHFKYS